MNNISFPNSTEAIQWSNPMCPLGADHSTVTGNRLRQNPNGSFEVAPKPMGYVLGELLRSSVEKLYHVAAWAFSGFQAAPLQTQPMPKVDNMGTSDLEVLQTQSMPEADYMRTPDLESLQARIDALGWSERLSVNPPRPTRSYPIKKEQAENWINGHICKKQQIAARALVEGTRHISQFEFEKELKKSVDQFNEWLETQDSKEYMVVVPHKGKSNYWVVQLALPHLKRLPAQVFMLNDNSLSNAIIEYYQKNPKVNKIVFFDDAAYSGSQSKFQICHLSKLDWISECGDHGRRCDQSRLNRYLNTEKEYKIIAIIPFMEDPASILPSSKVFEICSPKTRVESHIQVFSSQRLPKVGDFLSKKEARSIGCSEDKIPAYFDHKIADGFSTCVEIYSGAIRNREDYCEEDLGPEPSILEKLFYSGELVQEIRASKIYVQKLKEKKKANTKFIDDITPPYKH